MFWGQRAFKPPMQPEVLIDTEVEAAKDAFLENGGWQYLQLACWRDGIRCESQRKLQNDPGQHVDILRAG
jgi:hypothetical protein